MICFRDYILPKNHIFTYVLLIYEDMKTKGSEKKPRVTGNWKMHRSRNCSITDLENNISNVFSVNCMVSRWIARRYIKHTLVSKHMVTETKSPYSGTFLIDPPRMNQRWNWITKHHVMGKDLFSIIATDKRHFCKWIQFPIQIYWL